MVKKNSDGAALARSGSLNALARIMRRLLAPGGCKWDRQ